MQIPLVDLKAQYSSIEAELRPIIKDVFDNTAFIMGSHVKQFEENFSAYAKCKHTVGVSSGTDALLLAYQAAGLQCGDEVIVPPLTMMSPCFAVLQCGAVPVTCLGPLSWRVGACNVAREMSLCLFITPPPV